MQAAGGAERRQAQPALRGTHLCGCAALRANAGSTVLLPVAATDSKAAPSWAQAWPCLSRPTDPGASHPHRAASSLRK